jgi:hypothetical protein
MNIEEMFASGDSTFDVKQNAQIEIIKKEGGSVHVEDWIKANSERFEELVRDPAHNFIERLANPSTHAAAIEEIKQRLYN